MDMQLLVGIIIGVMAFIYLIKRFKKQLTQIEKDPKCDDCPVPNNHLKNDKKK